jgi:succinate dehydrogenase / fumarate reductase, membrane anchor subunit
VVRNPPVGAHYGLWSWLIQRGTAVAIAIYLLLFPVYAAFGPELDHVGWRQLFSPLPARIATEVFFLSVLLHAWVGVRDILMDYVRSAGLRLAAYVAVIGTLASYALWLAHLLGTV